MKILVVDDNDLFRDLLIERLRQLGHEITGADNPHSAISLINSDDFELVITDNDMDNTGDGLKVIVHAVSQLPKPDVIWMSGSADTQELRLKAIKLGALETLSKPFPIEQLRAMIQRIEAHRNMINR